MAANIQAYLENLRQPWGQIYYDILFEQLKDIKGKRMLDFGSGFGLVANHPPGTRQSSPCCGA